MRGGSVEKMSDGGECQRTWPREGWSLSGDWTLLKMKQARRYDRTMTQMMLKSAGDAVADSFDMASPLRRLQSSVPGHTVECNLDHGMEWQRVNLRDSGGTVGRCPRRGVAATATSLLPLSAIAAT